MSIEDDAALNATVADNRVHTVRQQIDRTAARLAALRSALPLYEADAARMRAVLERLRGARG